MSTSQDIIGVVRHHRWISAKEQKRRIEADGARIIVELDGKEGAARVVKLEELAKLTRLGTELKMVHAFLLANPKAQRKRGGLKASFDAAFELLTKKREGVLRDMETGLTTETAQHRKAILAVTYAHIARSNQGLSSALNGARSQGRPKKWTDAQVRQIIWEEWHSTLNRTNGQASDKASERIGRYVSPNTMWKVVKEMRAERGIGDKGASGRRPNVKALVVAAGSKRTQGVVYFVKNGKRRQIKIGYSGSVRTRMGELGTSTPENLKLLAHIPGDKKLETELHRRFYKYRIKGDWFRHEGALAKYVSGLPKPPKT
jgi:hypothetical protein